MTRYVECYDEYFDESFQVEVTEEELPRMFGVASSPVPNPNLPIMSRYRSDRHPEFYENEDAASG